VAGFFASGAAADLILLILAAEAVLLRATRRMTAAGAILAVLPGALLVLALRAALTGADWPWIALPLALSFPAHLADLAGRGARAR
jgi:uncharacterized membrane protein YjjP (DUF1212 family)